MDDINKARWNCHSLERLYIRIQGLNTKEKIDRAIQLWTDARISNVSIPKSDGSIEAHVARHLVQFKKLRAVWLGWKVRKAMVYDPHAKTCTPFLFTSSLSTSCVSTSSLFSPTTMMSPLASPLQIPEIIRRLSRFVTQGDAVACAQVCKTWTNDFVSAIWHTIDFGNQDKLLRMDAKILERHGNHIRVAKNVNSLDHIKMLIVSNATKLKEITVTMMATQEFYAYLGSIIRRNNTTIQRIDVAQCLTENPPFFAVDTLFPRSSARSTSQLSYLKISGLTMPRECFSLLLETCPLLDTLDIWNTKLLSWPIHGKSGANCYQHHRMNQLTATVKQVLRPDTNQDAPSLLVHFPGLRAWHMCDTAADSVGVPIDEIRDEVNKCCSSLKLLWAELPASMATEMLVQVFDGLSGLCCWSREISAELVMAIIRHRDTLTQFFTFTDRDDFYTSDSVPDIKETPPEAAGWIIQSIPQNCPRLTTLMLHTYEMNMDDIEKATWSCHKLEILYIRIHALDTKEKINRAIKLWGKARIAKEQQLIEGQSSSSANTKNGTVILPSDNSIEARVARHLLKFKKLREVWLGWRIRR
ncbi:hypothetical protein BGX31_003683, partial [Mortierella sp. GBA43]